MVLWLVSDPTGLKLRWGPKICGFLGFKISRREGACTRFATGAVECSLLYNGTETRKPGWAQVEWNAFAKCRLYLTNEDYFELCKDFFL